MKTALSINFLLKTRHFPFIFVSFGIQGGKNCFASLVPTNIISDSFLDSITPFSQKIQDSVLVVIPDFLLVLTIIIAKIML